MLAEGLAASEAARGKGVLIVEIVSPLCVPLVTRG